MTDTHTDATALEALAVSEPDAGEVERITTVLSLEGQSEHRITIAKAACLQHYFDCQDMSETEEDIRKHADQDWVEWLRVAEAVEKALTPRIDRAKLAEIRDRHVNKHTDPDFSEDDGFDAHNDRAALLAMIGDQTND